MKLTEKISNDLKEAMKSKDKVALEALRAVKTAFTLAKTSVDTVLSDDDELKIIQKLVKQRRESASIYQSQNRPDLADKELSEVKVLEAFLPAKLSDGELTKIVQSIIAEVGAKSAAEIGKVMGIATKRLAGQADGKDISAKAKELLG